MQTVPPPQIVSDTTMETPETRFVQSTVPYVLVGGDTIAADWADLTDGTIDAPIDHDETGTLIADKLSRAWTGTSADVTQFSPCCSDWTSLDSGAAVGVPTAVDSTWSSIGGQPCTEVARLYCFEQ